MNQFHKVLRLAVLAVTFSLTGLSTAALAQRDPSPATGRPPPPRMPLLTMDQKVGMANHIFVGVGKRVYFAGGKAGGKGAQAAKGPASSQFSTAPETRSHQAFLA